jgi:hypothetical protein
VTCLCAPSEQLDLSLITSREVLIRWLSLGLGSLSLLKDKEEKERQEKTRKEKQKGRGPQHM